MATTERIWTSGGQHPGGDGLTKDPSAVKLFRAHLCRIRASHLPNKLVGQIQIMNSVVQNQRSNFELCRIIVRSIDTHRTIAHCTIYVR